MRDRESSEGGEDAPAARRPGGWFEPLWRRVLGAGWGVFVVSFLLPAMSYSCEAPPLPPPPPPPPPPADATAPEPDPSAPAPSDPATEPDPSAPAPPELTPRSPSPASLQTDSGSASADGAQTRHELIPGWQAFWFALVGAGGPIGIISGLTNLLMVATALHRRWSPRARWPARALAAAGALNLGYWHWLIAGDGESVLQMGYYVWVASFVCTAAGFWLRRRKAAASCTV